MAERTEPRAPSPATIVDLVRLGLAIVGIAAVGYGAWLHYPPLGYAAGGALALVVAIIGGLRAK